MSQLNETPHNISTLDQKAKTNHQKIFQKHATLKEKGEQYLSKQDFISIISPQEDYTNIKREQYGILFDVADRNKTGKLSFTDYLVFSDILSKPDAEYIIAFKLFDTDNKGSVSISKIKEVLSKDLNPQSFSFDFNTPWFKFYEGYDKESSNLDYGTFCQLLKGIQPEKLRQSFRYYDKNKTGYISPEDFKKIISQISKYKLSNFVIEHAPTMCNISPNGKISYANLIAFHNIVRQLDLVEIIVKELFLESKDGTITKADFMNMASRKTRFTLFTPMEVDIIFHFAGIDNINGRIGPNEFARLLEPKGDVKIKNIADESSGKDGSFLWEVVKQSYSFLLGSIAGAVGATVVYPIDLVKTRMQNQRSVMVGQLLYKNSIDCFKKVISNEGFKGLYRGLGPQLIGVAPEKAIKLTMNDLARSLLTNKETGKISVYSEMLSGSIAGASQVIFTNPLEIVKIRLQVQGEVSKALDIAPKRGAIAIVKQLGLFGLYKGAGACLLRDIPFSAIYFTTYAHLKKDYFKETPLKKLTMTELLVAGAIAGMPAAYLTTPADVIKTRLQVEVKKGETSYTGILDAARKIFKEEGFAAFFKGGPARIFRSSPQFGCTLMVYELLQRAVPITKVEQNFMQVASTISPTSNHEYELLRSKHALRLLSNLDYKFGAFSTDSLKKVY